MVERSWNVTEGRTIAIDISHVKFRLRRDPPVLNSLTLNMCYCIRFGNVSYAFPTGTVVASRGLSPSLQYKTSR